MSNQVKLSASRIKVFQDCSWTYYAKYILKLPDKGNSGSSRGSIVHLILELLVYPKHTNHLKLINDKMSVFASKAIHRLILKHAIKLKVSDPENLEMINEMILVALKHDFHCSGSKIVTSEEAFDFKTDKYQILVFIDKIAIYDNSAIDLVDYKSSKAKFSKDDMDGNLQTLMYSLVCYKTKGIIPQVKFLFLRFPKAPVVKAEKCTEEELQGFENYLVYLTDYLNNFSLAKATANYAYNSPDKKWLCGFNKYKGHKTKLGKEMWGCAFKFPYHYYALIDEKTGNVLKSSEDIKDLKIKEGQKIVYKLYKGCPAWGNKITKPNETISSV